MGKAYVWEIKNTSLNTNCKKKSFKEKEAIVLN